MKNTISTKKLWVLPISLLVALSLTPSIDATDLTTTDHIDDLSVIVSGLSLIEGGACQVNHIYPAVHNHDGVPAISIMFNDGNYEAVNFC